MGILNKQDDNNLLLKLKLLSAEGVPIPDEKKLARNVIVRREVGVMIYDKFKSGFIENSVYVKAKWLDTAEDM